MVIDMNEKKLVTLDQLRGFIAATSEVEFQGCGQDEERYRHIEAVLKRFGYVWLGRADKGLVLRYLEPVSYTHLDVYKRQPDYRGPSLILVLTYRLPKFGRRFSSITASTLRAAQRQPSQKVTPAA